MCSFYEKELNISDFIRSSLDTFIILCKVSNSAKNIFKIIEGKRSAKCFVYKRYV